MKTMNRTEMGLALGLGGVAVAAGGFAAWCGVYAVLPGVVVLLAGLVWGLRHELLIAGGFMAVCSGHAQIVTVSPSVMPPGTSSPAVTFRAYRHFIVPVPPGAATCVITDGSPVATVYLARASSTLTWRGAEQVTVPVAGLTAVAVTKYYEYAIAPAADQDTVIFTP